MDKPLSKTLVKELIKENIALKETQIKLELELLELKKTTNDLTKNFNHKLDDLSIYEHLSAHEIKSALRNISTFVNWIRRDSSENSGITNNLNLIDDSLEKMDNLLTNVLMYSNLKKEKKKSTIDVTMLLNEIMSTTENPHKATIAIKQKLPIIKFNLRAIEQLLQHLISYIISNVNKAHEIIAFDYTEHDDSYLFMINNNGSVMKKNDYNTIFSENDFIDSNDRNSSLELLKVRKIVKLYGGNSWFESPNNSGTTFYFTLPK